MVSCDLFIQYINSIKVSEYIKEIGNNFLEGEQHQQQNSGVDVYLDLMIKITLHYIKVQNEEEKNELMQNENNEVNATACEFLEQLTIKIDNP